jgi:YHS domain-containing protein
MSWQSVVYLLVWAGLFAFMMRFGCGAHVMGHSRHKSHAREEPAATGANAGTGSAAAVAQTARDPVCGMKVSTTEAKTSVHRGSIYYFCSQQCREKFEASPAIYSGSSVGS